jgi:pimeloyl-ACP methyl ester carboxylesterase
LAYAYISWRGLRIASLTVPGESPGLFFLPGFNSNQLGIKAQYLRGWAERHGVAFASLDYSGHGASDGDLSDGSIGDWLSQAETVLDECTSGPQLLIGSSMGGWLALLLAIKRPDRVAGLLGLAIAPDFTQRLQARLTEGQMQELRSAGHVTLPSEFPTDRPYRIGQRLLADAEPYLLLGRETLPVVCPMALLHGQQDDSAPWQLSLTVSERVQSRYAEVLLVRDGEHRLSRDVDLARMDSLLTRLHDTIS